MRANGDHDAYLTTKGNVDTNANGNVEKYSKENYDESKVISINEYIDDRKYRSIVKMTNLKSNISTGGNRLLLKCDKALISSV